MPHRFARLGPPPRYDVADAGLCLTAFALIRRDGKMLLGIPRQHPKWEEEWTSNWTVYTPEERAQELRLWRFPSSYLIQGEDPAHTLDRIMRDQLQLPHYRVKHFHVESFYDPSSWFPGKRHWDVCFLYEVTAPAKPPIPPWFSRLEYVNTKPLTAKDFGSYQGDLAARLKLIASQ